MPKGFTMSEPKAPLSERARSPSLAVLERSTVPAPAFPLEVLGPFWSEWVTQAAEGANAPLDFVATPLLTAASALIGNARWATAWAGWSEPPVLFAASVGNPSSGKSPGAGPVREALGRVEAHMARNYPEELERWRAKEVIAKAVQKAYEKAVADAVKAEEEPPVRPDTADLPPPPVRPRAFVADATVEALATLLSQQPRGVLHLRDELAGFLLNLGRYANGGTDRPFWLEAYNGGRHRVDRKSNPEPIILEHLAVPIFGTIQPERLADLFEGPDDGLASRFLWAWPDADLPFRRPKRAADVQAATDALIRLSGLLMSRDDAGMQRPSPTRMDDDAVALMEAFGQEMKQAERTGQGMMKSTIGKARGQALRLALILEYLRWCGRDGIEPATISAEATRSAITLMQDYFLPMARRVLGDAAIPPEEARARTLAEFIVATQPALVNVSSIRDGARLPGLRQSEPIKAACRYLVEAGWLTEERQGAAPGRPRGDFRVVPKLWSLLSKETGSAQAEFPGDFREFSGNRSPKTPPNKPLNNKDISSSSAYSGFSGFSVGSPECGEFTL